MDAATTSRCDLPNDLVYAVMRSNETRRPLPIHSLKSPYPKYYSTLATYVISLGEDFGLSNTTIFRAFALLNRTFTCPLINNEEQRYDFQLVVLNCVAIAAKFEETPENQPTLEELLEVADGHYSLEKFKQSERFVLNYLKWEVSDVTAGCFSNYFLSRSSLSSPALDHDVRELVIFLFGLSLQDYAFTKYLPSVLCASALKTARALVLGQLGMATAARVWGEGMVTLTKYKAADLEACSLHLLQSYEAFYRSLERDLAPANASFAS